MELFIIKTIRMKKTSNLITDYYKNLIETNGDFNWVNNLYMNTSQTVIDLDIEKEYTTEELEFMSSFSEAIFTVDICQIKSIDKKKEDAKIAEIKNKIKFLKNKTVKSRQKAKLGLLVQYEIENAKILNKNFTIENGSVICYLYRIDSEKKIKHKKQPNSDIPGENLNKMFIDEEPKTEPKVKLVQSEKTFAILSPVLLVDFIPIKLLNTKSSDKNEFSIEYFKVCFTKKIKISLSLFEKLIIFHHRLFSDLSNSKENDPPSISRLTDPNSEERKYLVCPIKKEKGKWKLNEKKILRSVDYNNKSKFGYSLLELFVQEKNKIKVNSTTSAKERKAKEKKAKDALCLKIRNKIFFSTYKFILYEINDLFFSDENSKSFFQKVAEHHNLRCTQADMPTKDIYEIIQLLKFKYFPDVPDSEFKNITNFDLILNVNTKADSINAFRRIGEINNIDIDYNIGALAYGFPIKSISNYDFSYNKHKSISQSNYQKNIKLKTDISIYPIFPIEHLNSYFLNRKEYKQASKLPSLLIEFERALLSYDLSNQFFPSNLKKESLAKYKNIQKFIHATTSSGLLQDYSFESMETLGDSIIKFILSLILFYAFKTQTEGELQSYRRDLLKNEKLQEVAIENMIYKYVVAQPLKISKWEHPLKRNLKLKFEQSIAKKCAADALEALVGASFMLEMNLKSSFNFMKRVGIINKEIIGVDIKDKIILDNQKWSLEEFKLSDDLSFFDIYFMNKSMHNSNASTQFVISDPFSNPVLTTSGKVNIKAVQEFEKRINYKFHDVNLLLASLTHQSFNKDYDKNYQRLELLGDSVLEVYILIKLFGIFKDKLFNIDEDYDKLFISTFNCGNLTHAKSLLVSNYFLMRLTVLLNLQEFILMKDKKNTKLIEEFFIEENIQMLLNEKINDYNPKITGSKVLSDIFEALLGAIMIDSNLQNCFNFLDWIYSPFLYYSSINLNRIKYSPVSELIEICHKRYGVGPKFARCELAGKMIEITVWAADIVVCKGSALSEDQAKQIAAMEGIRKIYTELEDLNSNI